MALNGESQFSEEMSGMIFNLAIAGVILFLMLFKTGLKFVADITEYSV
jgi:hypothetical protein